MTYNLSEILDQPGRVVVKFCGDDEWPWYWHAFIGDDRVNGGLAHSYDDGIYRGKGAISTWRREDWYRNYIFDYESGRWYKRGEDPPAV